MQVLSHPPSGWPALVLNADFRPLSYYPLSLWPWQEVIKAVFLDRVDVVSTYDQVVQKALIELPRGDSALVESYATLPSEVNGFLDEVKFAVDDRNRKLFWFLQMVR